MVHISTSHPQGVYYYMLFYLAAIIIGIAGAAIVARKNKFNLRDFAIIVSVGVLGLLIGSKLLMFDISQWRILFHEGHLPVENGKSALGAILGAMIGFWLAGRLLGQKESVLDLFAVSMPLALAVQGLGCLMAGCCHGSLTTVPWGITYGPGTRPFTDQEAIGFIPPDAVTSLAMHPSQLYSILICIAIAFIAWKTRSTWKSSSANFIFSITLYLAYRVMEQISGVTVQPAEIIGMSLLAWKVILLIFFTSLLIYRELTYSGLRPPVREISKTDSLYDLKLFALSFIVIVITLSIGDWLTAEERMVVLLTIFPLSGLVILEKMVQLFLSIRYARASWMVLVAFVIMGQKADKLPATQVAYTSFTLSGAFGNFDLDHTFNEEGPYSDGCGGSYWVGDDVGYHHQYGAGGAGISYKKYHTEWQSSVVSINAYMGKEKEDPIYNPNPDFTPPQFSNTLWSINPKVQYDWRGFGLGMGITFGNVGYDNPDDPDDHKDYSPANDGREISLQTRFRFFSERYFFIEILGGYDAGSIGQYAWQGLVGSRFNSDKFLFKTGWVGTKNGNTGFTFQGETPLGSNLFFSPSFMFYSKNEKYNYDGGSNRIVLGLEYRFYDK